MEGTAADAYVHAVARDWRSAPLWEATERSANSPRSSRPTSSG